MADELKVFERHWLLVKIGRAFVEMDSAAARGDMETAHEMFQVARDLLREAQAQSDVDACDASSAGAEYSKSA